MNNKDMETVLYRQGTDQHLASSLRKKQAGKSQTTYIYEI